MLRVAWADLSGYINRRLRTHSPGLGILIHNNMERWLGLFSRSLGPLQMLPSTVIGKLPVPYAKIHIMSPRLEALYSILPHLRPLCHPSQWTARRKPAAGPNFLGANLRPQDCLPFTLVRVSLAAMALVRDSYKLLMFAFLTRLVYNCSLR